MKKNQIIILGFLIICFKINAQYTLDFKTIDSLLYWIENDYYNPLTDIRYNNYRNVIEIKYSNLKTLDLKGLGKLKKNEKLYYEAKEIFNQDSIRLTLIVPTDSAQITPNGGCNFECEGNKSILNYFSGISSKYLMIELNPYCSQSYGADEIDITLFRTSSIRIPVVVILSNNPAYVPADIYIFNKEENNYEYLKTLHLY